jgi:hypothetical protein
MLTINTVCAFVLWFGVFNGDATVAVQHTPGLSMVVAARPPARRKPEPVKKTRPKPEKKPVIVPEPIPVQEPSPTAAPVPGAGLSGSNRIEFDAQLIKGQTTKAGEVQVLERKDTELKSMVKRRTSFRDEIIRTAFPDK